MARRNREVQVFSVSFLDVLSCALGGTLLLLLLLQQTKKDESPEEPTDPQALAELQQSLSEAEDRAAEAERQRDQAERERAEAEAARDRAENERDQAEGELAEAQQQIQENEATKFWVLSVNVTATVNGATGERTPVDWDVRYYMSLRFDGDQITGTLFGVEDVNKDTDTDSFGQARIEGTRNGDQIVFDLHYTGEAEGDIERVTATLDGEDRMEGELSSYASLPNHSGYEGSLTGVRLTP